MSPSDASFDFDGWSPIVVRHTDRRIFCGWWQRADGMVRTARSRAAAKFTDSLASPGLLFPKQLVPREHRAIVSKNQVRAERRETEMPGIITRALYTYDRT